MCLSRMCSSTRAAAAMYSLTSACVCVCGHLLCWWDREELEEEEDPVALPEAHFLPFKSQSRPLESLIRPCASVLSPGNRSVAKRTISPRRSFGRMRPSVHCWLISGQRVSFFSLCSLVSFLFCFYCYYAFVWRIDAVYF